MQPLLILKELQRLYCIPKAILAWGVGRKREGEADDALRGHVNSQILGGVAKYDESFNV